MHFCSSGKTDEGQLEKESGEPEIPLSFFLFTVNMGYVMQVAAFDALEVKVDKEWAVVV